MLSVFPLAAGGMYPCKYSILPHWEGGMLSFFSFGPRGLTRHQYLPYTRGGMLVFFLFSSPTGPNRYGDNISP